MSGALTVITRFITAGLLAACGTGLRAQTTLDASHYVWRPSRDAGSVVLRAPYGGEYVYARTEASDGRIAQRFSIGSPVRSEFVLFSADEEAALWLLRDRQRFPEAYAHRPPRRGPVVTAAAPLDWPKVIVSDGKTCVPETAYANAPNWSSHALCWVHATREVRHE